jgi:DNA-binding MarR family transcriptional regulator
MEDEKKQCKKLKGLFAPVPDWLIKDEDLKDLTPSEWYVLTAFAAFAYKGEGISSKGTTWGETFVGRETIAELTGMSVPSVDRAIRSLVEKGHLQNRRRYRNKVVRAVMFMLAVVYDDY